MQFSRGAAGGTDAPPSPDAVATLRPTLLGGGLHTLVSLLCLAVGIWLARSAGLPAYWIGQLLLAFAFLHAFVLLHEAGHDTLFPQRSLNLLVGHLAGFVTLLPLLNWQRIHARHHRYTGWQDLDATTASLVPRDLPAWQRRVINFAWHTGLPLFAVIYRIQNFWNLPRVATFISNPKSMRRIRRNTLVLLLAYGVVLMVLGPLTVLKLFGPAFLVSLVLQETLILSQHTHVPQRLSEGRAVRPFTPAEQGPFTRSLRLPTWLSVLLMHFDAHELHHRYPFVPGYRLRGIDYQPANEVHWWHFFKAARSLRGTDFLFRNWNDTGVRV